MKSEKKFLFKSIFMKFVFAFILVGLLPVMVISFFILRALPQDMEKDMISNYSQTLEYSSKNIEMKVSEYNQISQLVYYYQSKEYGSINQVLEDNKYQILEEFLRSTVFSEIYIESAFLLDSDLSIHSYFSQNSSFLVEDFDFGNYPKSGLIEENKKTLTILPVHNEDYFFRSENMVISFIRNYLDINQLPDEEKVVSTFCIEVNIDFIKNILDPISRSKEEIAFVLDRDGYPIYQSYSEESTTSFSEIFSKVELKSKGNDAGYISDAEGYIFYRKIKNTDWILVYQVEHSLIYQLINEFKNIGLVFMIILIVTLLLLALAFSKRLSQPIKNIINQMKVVESGDLTSEVSVKTNDEIHQLAQAFNRMVKRLNEYINKAYVAQLKQKETELNAIRSQIRPHYLYNTLEIIRMSALEEDASNTQSMIYALSEQLKYVIGYNKVKVTFKRELELVQNYFNIVYIRYEKRLRLELDIPQSLYNYDVLKLMIQPLVENAVIHGLKPKKGKGTIKISGTEENGMLKIQVIDDGIGISPVKLEEVQSILIDVKKQGSDISEEHIGLINVQSRIQLIYGNAYGIEISSKQHMGTLAQICIPIEESNI